jgi:hypothetical protein
MRSTPPAEKLSFRHLHMIENKRSNENRPNNHSPARNPFPAALFY